MAFKKTNAKRSPLKVAPLRNPGESLDREVERLLDEELLGYVFFTLAIIVLVINEWWEWLLKSPPQPIVWTVFGLVLLGFCVHKFFAVRSSIKLLQLGLDGEKIVGQGLEDLRDIGCKIIHDIPGDGFNIDHVVISRHGIFAIETKTYMKPSGGNARVVFDGETILVNGKSPNRDFISQALAERSWLKNFLIQNSGREFPVKAAIVFPGWFVEHIEKKQRNDLWVLNPKGLASFIVHEPVQISDEDVALATSRLSHHVRNYSKN